MKIIKPAERIDGIGLSLIRQINALATPLSANLGLGEPNLEPDERLREMARAAATGPWKYTANAGTMELRQLLAADAHVNPATDVCITAGTEEGFYSIFQAFAGTGDEVLIPDPGFIIYGTIARLSGADVVTYPIDPPEWKLDPASIISRITDRTKIIIVNSPSNPLGSIVDAEALDAVARAADERGCIVISDEVYNEIWYEEPPPTMLGRGENVLLVNGMSKSHGMTGLRMGWVIGRAELMKPIIAAHQYVATCASSFTQTLAASILADRDWNRGWLESVRSQFRRQRDAALHAIRRELEAEIPPPAGAFYAFVPVPTCDTVTFTMNLATDGAVLVIPGAAFGRNGEGFIRISYAAPPQEIATGIERVGRWLRSSGR